MEKIDYDKIPDELKALDQWLCWKAVPKPDGKIDKKPVDARTGTLAKTNEPDTWSAFDVARGYCDNHSRSVAGIGFVFSADDSYVGIDLDNCRDKDSGEIEPWAQEFIELVASYTEISPSSTGVKIWIKGKMPSATGRRKKYQSGEVEMYSHTRFFAVTGQHLAGTPTRISHNTDALVEIYMRVFGTDSKNAVEKPKLSATVTADDQALIEKAMNAESGPKFRRLWDGDTSGYASDSEADCALCAMLAYWTQGDRNRIDSLFRQSGLYREKWEREDYRQRTMDMALQNVRVYDPSYQSDKHVEEARQFNWTDLGNAERFAAQHGKNLRWLDDWGQWFVWDGKRWKRDNGRRIERMAKSTVRRMYQEASEIIDDERRQALIKYARACEGKQKLSAMVDLARSESGIPIVPEDLDTNQMLLNVENGTLNLESGKLYTHEPKHLITKLSPVHYDPNARCSLWLSFLAEIMDGNENLVQFLKRAVGYSLTGDTSEHCLFFMYGTGRNGKTTFIETLKALFGDYAQKAPTEMLMKKRYDGNIPNDIARLQGARVAVVAEVEEGRRLAESIVKDLTGGDTLTARFLRQEFFDFEPTHKIWMYGNYKPIIRGTDEGIWSRIPLIPFKIFIPEERRDKDLQRKLRNELPGILRWAVEGCLEWQRDGLGMPAEIKAATQEYRAEMDELGEFLDAYCVIDEHAWAFSADLWNAYQDWAKENNEKYPLGRRAFGNRLATRGLQNELERVQGKPQRIWRGIGLIGVTQRNEYDEGEIS